MGRDGPSMPAISGGENWFGLIVFVFALEKRVGAERGRPVEKGGDGKARR